MVIHIQKIPASNTGFLPLKKRHLIFQRLQQQRQKTAFGSSRMFSGWQQERRWQDAKFPFEIRLPHVVLGFFFKALDMRRRQTCVLVTR
ncbi:MAG: hypothetical protein ACLVB5_09015 [Christensenellales bacterium]